MKTGAEDHFRKSADDRQSTSRGSLSRERVLEAALRLVEESGVESLSMRRLGSELGVEAMSLYNHVSGKEALMEGLREWLWSQVQLPLEQGTDLMWKDALRPTLQSLRGLAQKHSNMYTLLLTCNYPPEPALQVFNALLRVLRRGGFDDEIAGYAMGVLLAYAAGYGLVELSCEIGKPDIAAKCYNPSGVDKRLADVISTLENCDPNKQFKFGLEVLLEGLEALKGKDISQEFD